MINIPYAYSNGYLSVRVDLKHASNVFLVDSNNFQKYKLGQSYTYFGGYYKQTPVNISVKGSGRWYLIVEGGGTYNYKFY